MIWVLWNNWVMTVQSRGDRQREIVVLTEEGVLPDGRDTQ